MTIRFFVVAAFITATAGLSGQTLPLSGAQLESYVGAYELAPGLVAKIILRGDRLFSVSPMGTTTELSAESDTSFVTRPDGVRIAFAKDDEGRVTHVYVGSPPTEKAARILVSSEILLRYVGNYPLTPSLSMVVSLEGDRLFVQGPGQSKNPIYPLSTTKFFVQDSTSNDSAELEFGASGQAEQSFVIFRQSGSEQKVMRK